LKLQSAKPQIRGNYGLQILGDVALLGAITLIAQEDTGKIPANIE
jgi:hypothetical protein